MTPKWIKSEPEGNKPVFPHEHGCRNSKQVLSNHIQQWIKKKIKLGFIAGILSIKLEF